MSKKTEIVFHFQGEDDVSLFHAISIGLRQYSGDKVEGKVFRRLTSTSEKIIVNGGSALPFTFEIDIIGAESPGELANNVVRCILVASEKHIAHNVLSLIGIETTARAVRRLIGFHVKDICFSDMYEKLTKLIKEKKEEKMEQAPQLIIDQVPYDQYAQEHIGQLSINSNHPNEIINLYNYLMSNAAALECCNSGKLSTGIYITSLTQTKDVMIDGLPRRIYDVLIWDAYSVSGIFLKFHNLDQTKPNNRQWLVSVPLLVITAIKRSLVENVFSTYFRNAGVDLPSINRLIQQVIFSRNQQLQKGSTPLQQDPGDVMNKPMPKNEPSIVSAFANFYESLINDNTVKEIEVPSLLCLDPCSLEKNEFVVSKKETKCVAVLFNFKGLSGVFASNEDDVMVMFEECDLAVSKMVFFNKINYSFGFMRFTTREDLNFFIERLLAYSEFLKKN